MKASKYLIKTRKASDKEDSPSYTYTTRAGMLHQTSAGIYTFSPLGNKVIKNITRVVQEEMDNSGALEIAMPVVQPADLWKESDRWEVYGDEMFKFTNREKRQFCLGPTHEEVVCDFARSFINSHKDLPVTVYQVGKKFRDELRPRQGLLRGREFLMKDAYSFDVDAEGCDKSYHQIREAYLRIFGRLGLEVLCIGANAGEMGGSDSEEIIAPSKWGEDKFAFTGGKYVKIESDSYEGEFERGIEVGHIFKLGTRYSEKMKVNFNDFEGKLKFCDMGCYGIGISRLVAAIIEQNHDEKGIIWPSEVSPFDVTIIPLGNSETVEQITEEIYQSLQKSGKDVLLDDRPKNPGVKFKDADLIGIPHRIIIGDRELAKGRIEYEHRATGEKVSLDSNASTIVDFFRK